MNVSTGNGLVSEVVLLYKVNPCKILVFHGLYTAEQNKVQKVDWIAIFSGKFMNEQ